VDDEQRFQPPAGESATDIGATPFVAAADIVLATGVGPGVASDLGVAVARTPTPDAPDAPDAGPGLGPARTVVLVEGTSDQVALQSLADRLGRNLGAEGVSVVPTNGATNVRRFLELFGPHGLAVRLAGLCDSGEEGLFRRGLARAGMGANLTRADMESLGFYMCQADLEDELIRSLGAASVLEVIDAQGELGSFRTLQKQPAQQGRTIEEQLRRFMGTRGGRKIRYGRLLVDALDLKRVPRPLDRLLAHV
jgi:hypothetical protein